MFDDVVENKTELGLRKKVKKHLKQQSQPNSWSFFEKLAAAIHQVELFGAKVKQNDKINGRQFDVTIRFNRGPYSYLTVVECKNHNKPLKAEAVEALFTKASDAKANKIVMVAASGFQSGCFDVAERHGIELFTLEENDEFPQELSDDIPIPAVNVWDIKLYVKGLAESIVLPEKRNMLQFLLRGTIIELENKKQSLESMIDMLNARLNQEATHEEKKCKINFSPSTTVTLPDILSGNTLESVTLKNLLAVVFSYKAIEVKTCKIVGLDPYVLGRSYKYRNAITGESKNISAVGLPVGFHTVIKAGRFYVDPSSEFSYYCDSTDGDVLKMTLIESYQHGDLLMCDLTVLRQDAQTYLEIIDEPEIARLTAMLKSLRKEN